MVQTLLLLSRMLESCRAAEEGAAAKKGQV
jgi:hypothetical protein